MALFFAYNRSFVSEFPKNQIIIFIYTLFIEL